MFYKYWRKSLHNKAQKNVDVGVSELFCQSFIRLAIKSTVAKCLYLINYKRYTI